MLSKNEFIRILKVAEEFRDAAKAFSSMKKKYPAGVEALASPEQYRALKIVEDQICDAMDALHG